MTHPMNFDAEWLEADGLGGFASGTVSGVRTRRYHGLLLVATQPPTGRLMLVNGFDAWIETATQPVSLSRQRYSPGVIAPESCAEIESFTNDPWPTWTFRLPDGARVLQEIVVERDETTVAVTWQLLGGAADSPEPQPSPSCRKLLVRPFLSGRDYHALHHENSAFQFEPERRDARLAWHPYAGVPSVISTANAAYRHEPHWYRNFQYERERERGLDFCEDLASPGVLCFDLSPGKPAAWILHAEIGAEHWQPPFTDAPALASKIKHDERDRRKSFSSPLHRAADAYFVKRGDGRTIVAGYPWFTDWGRDTFIALRGFCLASARLSDARDILLEWAKAVSHGMLPNRFADSGESPEYNAVDASLWYVIAVHEFLAAVDAKRTQLKRSDRTALERAVRAILKGYQEGTRFGIRCDADGLLAAGEAGVQLTWMDAKVGDWVVTPRIGKPVEVQALWLNALWSARQLDDRWAELFVHGRDSFRTRFWSEARGCLYDVIDCDHRSGKVDARFRPNQIFAVGGLPIALFENGRARKIVDAVERRLWTPLGLRTLSEDDPDYAPHYRGGVRERDGAYHQGTVWPWLIGPFVEAWLRVRGNTPAAQSEARERFLSPLYDYLAKSGLGHVPEVAEGAAPHDPGGCPFQAWSLSELMRLENCVLENRTNLAESAATIAKASAFVATPRPTERYV